MWNLTNNALFTNFSNSKRKISNCVLHINYFLLIVCPSSPEITPLKRREEGRQKNNGAICFILLTLGSLSSPDGILFRRNQWARKDLFSVQALVRYSITQCPHWEGDNSNAWVKWNWTPGMNSSVFPALSAALQHYCARWERQQWGY